MNQTSDNPNNYGSDVAEVSGNILNDDEIGELLDAFLKEHDISMSEHSLESLKISFVSFMEEQDVEGMVPEEIYTEYFDFAKEYGNATGVPKFLLVAYLKYFRGGTSFEEAQIDFKENFSREGTYFEVNRHGIMKNLDRRIILILSIYTASITGLFLLLTNRFEIAIFFCILIFVAVFAFSTLIFKMKAIKKYLTAIIPILLYTFYVITKVYYFYLRL